MENKIKTVLKINEGFIDYNTYLDTLHSIVINSKDYYELKDKTILKEIEEKFNLYKEERDKIIKQGDELLEEINKKDSKIIEEVLYTSWKGKQKVKRAENIDKTSPKGLEFLNKEYKEFFSKYNDIMYNYYLYSMLHRFNGNEIVHSDIISCIGAYSVCEGISHYEYYKEGLQLSMSSHSFQEEKNDYLNKIVRFEINFRFKDNKSITVNKLFNTREDVEEFINKNFEVLRFKF